MISLQQRADLQRQIGVIVNDVRAFVDGWDVKQRVLGAFFYPFISENFNVYMLYANGCRLSMRHYLRTNGSGDIVLYKKQNECHQGLLLIFIASSDFALKESV